MLHLEMEFPEFRIFDAKLGLFNIRMKLSTFKWLRQTDEIIFLKYKKLSQL